ncbi:nitroreductase family protein [Viridibacterium curvum]|uniref:Nitroreductase family protein n=1 Tax=Viridibacterium curvum TaxID=1101404 RepID=A0ABP9QZM7_9RHOO
MSLKKLVWRLTPPLTHRLIRDVHFVLKLLPNYAYDFRRFLLYSGINKSRGLAGEHAAQVVLAYHQIEKGLSYAEPRPGFGKEVVERLLRAMGRFVALHGWVAPATVALRVLYEYVAFNEAAGLDMTALRARLAELAGSAEQAQAMAECASGGALPVRRSELEARRVEGFADFFASRHSVRQFAGGAVTPADVAAAVAIAQKTPSVCNRQAWRVHAFQPSDQMQQLMAIQGGSRGFGERAGALLVVTCDLACFVEAGERYQAWIDGGMFSMSLCLAFHSMGFGTCCLAWSKERQADKALRTAMPLPVGEQVIMFMAVGTLPESFNVAVSTRRALGDMLTFH